MVCREKKIQESQNEEEDEKDIFFCQGSKKVKKLKISEDEEEDEREKNYCLNKCKQ